MKEESGILLISGSLFLEKNNTDYNEVISKA